MNKDKEAWFLEQKDRSKSRSTAAKKLGLVMKDKLMP